MRRTGLTESLGSIFCLSIVSVLLLGLTTRSSADVHWEDPPRVEGTTSRPQADLEGLDRQVQELVQRPAPADLSKSAAAESAVVGSIDRLSLAGPQRTDPSPTAVPSIADADPSRSGGSAAAATSLLATALPDDLVDVFGDVMGELSPPDDSPPSEAEPRLADRPSRDESSPATAETATRSIPPHVAPLESMVEQCLQVHAQHRLNSGQDSCWSMMHAFLGWGSSCEVHIGGPRGPRTNAIAWVGQNQPCGGRRLFYLDGNRIRGREGPGYQGHPAQFLAMLAQCHIDPSFPLRVNDRNFTVADLINEEQRTCTSGAELTFKLIGLVHYLGTEATWTSDRGESWDMPKILAIELAQPINGAACGGTHRIMAISYAVAKRREEGGAMTGQWWRAEKYVADYHQYTLTLQNHDGSFSSDWFRQRADWGDMNRRVQTTGHILEWLAYSLPEESLYDPQVVNAVNYLTRTMTQHRYHDWEVGPKGHAIRALRLYHQRVFEQNDRGDAPLAQRPASAESNR
jgi:hypothetical protein